MLHDLPMEFTAARTFSSIYIALDIVWLMVFAGILLYFRKRTALVAGLVMGLVLFAIDYGIYYRVLGTRHITGADPFWFLLWFSMSYGLTMFAWIWLLLDRDRHAAEWSLLPILGWLAVAQLSENFGGQFAQITTVRGVGYHGVMAGLLLVGYAALAVWNLRRSRGEPRAQVQPGQRRAGVNILWLMAIGIGVQFAWEAVLLVSGIRPPLWQPIVVNSLIETNAGMPILYLVHKVVTRRWTSP
jgi:hypothetical protein